MKKLFFMENKHLYILAIINFLFIFISAFIPGYEYFIDEFYYIACANNPAFGYVDHPPLAPLILMVYKFIFGESLYSLRFLAALASSVTVFLSGLIAKQLGGNKFAQSFASFCIIVTPVFFAIGSFYSMNVFEPLLCLIVIYYLIKMIKDENTKYWINIGIVFGLLILNKHTAGLFVIFFILALLLTNYRKYLFTKHFLYCVLITFVLFFPNLIWQIQNNYPSLEFYVNNVTKKNVAMPFAEYIIFQIIAYNPLVFIISFAGAIFLFVNKNIKPFKVLGLIFFLIFLFFLITRNGRVDRSSFGYICVIPAGAILLEDLIIKIKQRWMYYTFASLMFLFFILFIPLLVPYLSYENSERLTNFIGLNTEIEKGKKPLIPQMIADRIGWKEKVDMVGKIYLTFSEEERNKIIISADNYGNAGSLELYGKKYGFKNVVCGHNNYYLWSKNRLNGDIVLMLTNKRSIKGLKEAYEIVDTTNVLFDNIYCSPHERNLTVYICKKPKYPKEELLEHGRFYY